MDADADIGLGGFPAVSLAKAREKAVDYRAAVAEGRDPLAEKRAPAMPTFREAACAVHEANKPRWRNAKHIASWMQTLERHAMPTLGKMPIDRIGRAEVLRVLTPIWATRPETARRVRQRMRTVFRWAMAHGFMETNPAGEAIDGALPSMLKVKSHLEHCPIRKSDRRSKPLKRPKPQHPPSCVSGSWFSRRRAPVRPGALPGTRSTSRTRYGGYRPSG